MTMKQQPAALLALLLTATSPSSAAAHPTGYRCTGDVHSALIKSPPSLPLPANVAVAACVSALSKLIRDDLATGKEAASDFLPSGGIVDFGYLGGSSSSLALPGSDSAKLIWEDEADDFLVIWEAEADDFLVQPLPFETAIVVGKERASPSHDDGETVSLDGLAVNLAGVMTEYNPTRPPSPEDVDPYNPTRPPGRLDPGVWSPLEFIYDKKVLEEEPLCSATPCYKNKIPPPTTVHLSLPSSALVADDESITDGGLFGGKRARRQRRLPHIITCDGLGFRLDVFEDNVILKPKCDSYDCQGIGVFNLVSPVIESYNPTRPPLEVPEFSLVPVATEIGPTKPAGDSEVVVTATEVKEEDPAAENFYGCSGETFSTSIVSPDKPLPTNVAIAACQMSLRRFVWNGGSSSSFWWEEESGDFLTGSVEFGIPGEDIAGIKNDATTLTFEDIWPNESDYNYGSLMTAPLPFSTILFVAPAGYGVMEENLEVIDVHGSFVRTSSNGIAESYNPTRPPLTSTGNRALQIEPGVWMPLVFKFDKNELNQETDKGPSPKAVHVVLPPLYRNLLRGGPRNGGHRRLPHFTTFDGLKLDLDVFVDDVTIHTAKDLGFSLEPMTSYNPTRPKDDTDYNPTRPVGDTDYNPTRPSDSDQPTDWPDHTMSPLDAMTSFVCAPIMN